MTEPILPLIVEPDQLERELENPNIRIVDLCKTETYNQAHVPGAVHLEYPRILRTAKPVMGLLPSEEELGRVLGALGISPDTHVVAYDDEGGGKASRLLWTLDVIGHRGCSLLNGGLHAWANEGHPLENVPVEPGSAEYPVRTCNQGIVDKAYVLEHLNDPDTVLVDARTAEEYSGAKKLAERGGHIPGAVNLDWLTTMDRQRNLRFLSEPRLREMLAERGIEPDKQVVAYCQTHHRSAHTYMMLKSLGYERVAGYPGSWSDWGNDPETPVE